MLKSIIKVFKRNLDLNNLINYLKKVIELNDQNLDAYVLIYILTVIKRIGIKKIFSKIQKIKQ